MDIAQVCRICANKIKDQKRDRNIFKYMRGKLLVKLKLITGVELTTNEGLPEFVCERCFSELDLATKFRERCIFSQKYLLDMKKKSKGLVVVDNDVDPQPLDEQLIDADQFEADYDEDYMIYDRTKEEDSIDQYQPEIDPEVSILETVEEAQDADIEDQQLERASKRRRNFFICDECGQLFHDEYSYNEHLDGHLDRREMKKFFPCTECPETFKKKSLLKQHRELYHESLRQFKCRFCGDVFSAQGARQRHEKAHENERPYPCLECGMKFSSVIELKDHCLTHPEEKRKYWCEPCSLDFISRKALLAHRKTQPHKRLERLMKDEIDLIFDS
ncbi:transcription factor Ouib isoform X1 [Drosophila ficusphila]|uniref:transcription factor Ouib isoform X1 n=1 Tax=Drosophila ficusphila TaxID=30025 RepID=UPI0007E6A3D9|nr:transcription factor Ouib isoform X1 [Drosophila ficusphila]